MKLRSTINGGFAEVSDEDAPQMIASGWFEAVEAPKPARKPRAPKSKPAPKQEPKSEE
ncbi:hypothetical protein PBI_IRONMAN_19 [Mycobacterium phage IronMan]|uniref:Head-to-tail connector protein n=1 Tax=Mycobacterium phage IronMan TaxID=2499042 RepID=A0A3S9UD60_9CAUD|nr:head-tail connector protein [Mycobacterium phage IronMan]AZS08221.1 hypothetical protein PBI_IRONMAN_19 [Mycobacterium phage IronMan]